MAIYCFLFLVFFVVQQSLLLTHLLSQSIRQILHAHLLFKVLDDVSSLLKQVEQRSSRAVPWLGYASDTSGRENDMGETRRQLQSKMTYKTEKAWGASDVGQLFVTGLRDAATQSSHSCCRIVRKNVSVLTHGHHEILRHFQGSKHFPRDQHLRLETPGWEMLIYEATAMSPAEVERQREKIMRTPLVVRDREYPFSEDVIFDETGAVDPNLGNMAKVSSLI